MSNDRDARYAPTSLRVRPCEAANPTDPAARRVVFVVQQAAAEPDCFWRDISQFGTQVGAEAEVVRLEAIRAAVPYVMSRVSPKNPPALPTTVRYPVAVIGDVHGNADLLDGLLDVLAAKAPDHTPVFVGDFVDRGPNSRRVIERAIQVVAACGAAVMGNHDLALVRAAGLDDRPPSPWWRERYRDLYTSEPTLTSYLGRRPTKQGFFDALDELRLTMPSDHRLFLAGLPWLVSAPAAHGAGGSVGGGHLFLHAGLSRNVRLSAEEQVIALVGRKWSSQMAAVGTAYAHKSHNEYPPWVGADRTACADPLPLHNWCQVTGHETVPEPQVVGNGVAVRIDTSGGLWGPLSACLLSGPGDGVRFVCYPARRSARTFVTW